MTGPPFKEMTDNETEWVIKKKKKKKNSQNFINFVLNIFLI